MTRWLVGVNVGQPAIDQHARDLADREEEEATH